MLVGAIVFDFDGTLVFSNALKRAAYRDLFVPGPLWDERLERVLIEHVNGTRHDVIRAMLRHGAPPAMEVADGEDAVSVLASRYDRIVTDGAANCRERQGAGDGLARLAAGRLSQYLLSMTPEDSLRRIVVRRGWDGYFRQIRGYPCEKSDELRAFAVAEGIDCGAVLMVGDSDMDRRAAEVAGTQYLHLNDNDPFDRVIERVKQ